MDCLPLVYYFFGKNRQDRQPSPSKVPSMITVNKYDFRSLVLQNAKVSDHASIIYIYSLPVGLIYYILMLNVAISV